MIYRDRRDPFRRDRSVCSSTVPDRDLRAIRPPKRRQKHMVVTISNDIPSFKKNLVSRVRRELSK